MKKMLMTATVPSTIGQFNMSNIHILIDLGYEVHVACNFNDRSVWTDERVKKFKTDMDELGVTCHHLDFSRRPLRLFEHIKSFRQLNALIIKESIELIHCHTPIAGMISRLVAHKNKLKVIYTAHGFHFYKGAPIKNWLVYYPAEKICSYFTDVLITINKEDYAFAQKKMMAKRAEYVPGVGIDITRFASKAISEQDKFDIRASLGIGLDDKLLLSVGELNTNKNHEIVIKALAKLGNSNVHYAIAGQGVLYGYLSGLAKSLGIEKQVHLLGFRQDVAMLYQVSDLFIHPSYREGLPVAVMEAIASKVSVICSNIRGNSDLVSGVALFKCDDVDELVKKVMYFLNNDCSSMVIDNYEKLKKFDIHAVNSKMKSIYISN